MWTFNRSCSSDARLDNKIAVITGANSGIGKETAKDFYRRGAKVIMACRNMEKAQLAMEDIKNTSFSGNIIVGELTICHLDLCDLESVRKCAKHLLATETAIHILVNNAGVCMYPYQKTKDGFEMQFQSNYLGHFLLTILLLPRMQLSTSARIVNVASFAYIFGNINFADINLERSIKIMTPLKGYTQSKLANILFTRELARRLQLAEINGIKVYCLHPGVINTEIGRYLGQTIIPGATLFRYILSLFIKNAKQGAQTTIHCAVDEKTANETGLYYKECRVTIPLSKARNDHTARKLWDYTCQLLHLECDENLAAFLQTVSHQLAE